MAIVTLIAGDTKLKIAMRTLRERTGILQMETKNSREAKTRMVHVHLPGGIHKKVRIRAAEADQTIQDWVLQAIQNELKLSESKSGVDKADK